MTNGSAENDCDVALKTGSLGEGASGQENIVRAYYLVKVETNLG